MQNSPSVTQTSVPASFHQPQDSNNLVTDASSTCSVAENIQRPQFSLLSSETPTNKKNYTSKYEKPISSCFVLVTPNNNAKPFGEMKKDETYQSSSSTLPKNNNDIMQTTIRCNESESPILTVNGVSYAIVQLADNEASLSSTAHPVVVNSANSQVLPSPVPFRTQTMQSSDNLNNKSSSAINDDPLMALHYKPSFCLLGNSSFTDVASITGFAPNIDERPTEVSTSLSYPSYAQTIDASLKKLENLPVENLREDPLNQEQVTERNSAIPNISLTTSENLNNASLPVLDGANIVFLSCMKCEALFKTETALQNHLNVDHSYKCTICNTELCSKEEYEHHVQITHLKPNNETTSDIQDSKSTDASEVEAGSAVVEKRFSCDTCQKKFPNRTKLKLHIANHLGIKEFECSLCGMAFVEKYALNKHMNSHLRKDIPCEICDKLFKNEKTLKKHLLTHKDRQFTCKICSKVYVTKEGLKTHASVHSLNGSEFKCPDCGRDCRSKKYLKLHMSHKHRPSGIAKTMYSCPECGKQFGWLKNLTNHRRINHDLDPGKNVECPVCDKKFVRVTLLKVHMMKHENIRHFSCSLCDEKFKYKQSCRNHMKIVHSDKKEYQCSTCGKLFKTNAYLEVHIHDVHQAVTRVNCSYCDKSFKTSKIMQNHVKLCHTKELEKKYKCRYCSKAFLAPKDLSRHEKTHTGIKDHMCSVCGRAFSRADNLKAHVKTHKADETATQ